MDLHQIYVDFNVLILRGDTYGGDEHFVKIYILLKVKTTLYFDSYCVLVISIVP